MRIHIKGQGDTSVGIPDPSATVDLGDCDLDEDDRKFLRKSLSDTFSEFWDSYHMHVFFEDECVDCGQTMILRPKPLSISKRFIRMVYVCENPKCISNIAIDDNAK